MTRGLGLILLAVVVPLGAGCGYVAGPFFARAHPRVQLAARIWAEESRGLEERTEESKAFRASDEPFAQRTAALYAEARRIERGLRIGTALFGAWCGLVIGLKLLASAPARPRAIYEIEQADCVACGRCFLSCPREHVRRKELGRLKT